MSFLSPQFLLFLLGALVLFHALPRAHRRIFILPLLNILFIAAFLTDAWQLIPFALFFMFCYGCVKVMERRPERRLLAAAIAVILALFLYIKQYSIVGFLPELDELYLRVGLSYVLFRVLHLLIDLYGGAIKERISFLAFSNYTLFFLAFVSGPIQRYEEYAAQERGGRLPDTEHRMLQTLSRGIMGCIKISIIASAAFTAFQYFEHHVAVGALQGMTIVCYAAACVCYTLFLYYNFSGYIDLVIAAGHLFGFELPENFNHPFAAKNFMDFWSRWHITLSNWFKFYLFNPILKALTSRSTSPRWTPYYGVLCYFITFFVMGLWHGTTPAFLVFGLFLGLGVSLNKLYDVELHRRLSKQSYRTFTGRRWYQTAASAAAVSYFCIGLTCLWQDAGDALWLFTRAGIPALLLIAAGAAGATFLTGLLRRLFRFLDPVLRPVQASVPVRQAALGLMVFLFLCYQIISLNPAPEFIYKGF